MDLSITNVAVITCDDDRRVLEDAAVVDEKTVIAEASGAAMKVWELAERRHVISRAIA